MKKWDKKEVKFLKKNYLNLTQKDLASTLKRNKKSVEWKLSDMGLKRTEMMSKSKILRNYYKIYEHHTKGKPKSEEQRIKMGKSRKEWLKHTNQEILDKIYKKISRTKIRTGVSLGEKNSMYGKKRLDLSNRNKEKWKNPEFRKKMSEILLKIAYKGSKKQRNLYNHLKKYFRNINYNDWKTLNYEYEMDISLPSKKIVVEWDGYRWHNSEINKKRDMNKNTKIIQKGWKFIRVKDDHLNKYQTKEIHENIVHLINNINAPEFKYTGGFYI